MILERIWILNLNCNIIRIVYKLVGVCDDIGFFLFWSKWDIIVNCIKCVI